MQATQLTCSDIRDEQQPQKRHFSSAFVFRRVVSDADAFAPPKIPEVHDASKRGAQTVNGGAPDRPHNAGAVLETRRFLLSRSSALPTASTKHKQGHGKGDSLVAVLVEDTGVDQPKRTSQSDIAESIPRSDDPRMAESSSETGIPLPRKRPGQSAAVPKPVTRGSDRMEDQGTTDLHEALQRYAVEELVQPTPQIPLLQVNQDDRVTTTGLDIDDEMEYVYDTYVRYAGPKASSSMDTMAAAEGSVGLLVITEQDQELWQTYEEDDGDSEQDWDSEQDDENGE